MSRKPKTPETPTAEGELRFDRYRMVVMNRAELVAAQYNPRVITDAERKKLKAVLDRHGMVQPPVFNERTKRLVSGHQRLSQLDSLNGSPNYQLQVAVIDVDESVEKEINIALNNQQAAGDWDLAKLDAMLSDNAVVLAGTGFDAGDVYRLLGAAPGGSGSTDQVEQMAGKLREFSDSYAQIHASAATRDDFYLVVVFRDEPERTAFITALGLEDNRYQSGVTFQGLLAARKVQEAATT